MKRFVIGFLLLSSIIAIVAVVGIYVLATGATMEPLSAGTITDKTRSLVNTADRSGRDKQILFGDLHVHSTFSTDAHQYNLPIYLKPQGINPVADACDYARFCSAIDFWSINDHAESLTPRMWQETKQAIRQCNQVTDPAYPDTVAFLGYEWSQVGATPETHYGHKNVVFKETADDQVPRHPIASAGETVFFSPPWIDRAFLALSEFPDWDPLLRFNQHITETAATEHCDSSLPLSELPTDCRLYTATPAELFARLDEWGGEALVIPHGNAWGLFAPAGSTWDKQLTASMNDPQRQKLIEVYSGHGNSEEYRRWTFADYDGDGKRICPEPQPNYLPGCWQAGEIIRNRCLALDRSADECEQRAAKARADFLASESLVEFMSVPRVTDEEVLDAGQCRDCWMPAFRHRPGTTAQYALAITNFDDENNPLRFNFGFIGSSDTHTARGGNGFKEIDRFALSDTSLVTDEVKARFADQTPLTDEELITTKPWQPTTEIDRLRGALNFAERQASFMQAGGMVAVHSAGRDRQAIWDALQRREVYGTSGPRFSLWFDLVTEQETHPMGSMMPFVKTPTFKVKALGDFKQKPGCPDFSVNALGAQRVADLCLNECYHPSDEREKIVRIEVIRIQPQQYADEPVTDLIQDAWKVLPCPADGNGCMVEFSDPEYITQQRDTTYYVRAIAEARPTINGGLLGVETDPEGNVTGVDRCDVRGDSDCLKDKEPRAWSSPIFLQYTSTAIVQSTK